VAPAAAGGIRLLEIVLKLSLPKQASSRNVLPVALALFLMSLGYNFLRYEMTDTAFFGGDTWYYQSIAVNVASGEGYRFGSVLDFNEYKFDMTPDEALGLDYKENLKKKYLATNLASFYGSPGYPLFLAGIYRLTGIHPIAAKFANVLLVAITAALLPVISARMFRNYGLVTGVIVSLFFIFKHAPDPSNLLGEPLIMFLMAAWGTLFTYSEEHLSLARIVALGLLTPVLILVKTYPLLVILAAVFIGLKYPSRRKGWVMAALYFGLVAVLILPWSVYATRHSDRVVVISTQFDALILDGNNEDVITSGGYQPQWRNTGDPKYLFNRLADSDLSAMQKVGRFYRENWMHLPQMFANKIYSATGRKVNVILGLLLFVAYYVMGRRRHRDLRREGKPVDVPLPAFPLFCFAVMLMNSLIGFGLLRYTLIFLPFMLLASAQAPLLFWKMRQERRPARG
jgi:hypothetical protein